MMKYACIPLIVIMIFACKPIRNMTATEIELVNNGLSGTPFRVLKTDNHADSVFLRKKCADFPEKDIRNSADLDLLIKRLRRTLAEEMGVGIAAPQVGIGLNLFLFMRMDHPDRRVDVAINPRIIAVSEQIIHFENDGCLSIPDRSGTTKRYAWVDVEYFNDKGEIVKERLSGVSREGDFTGVIFQHEFDHLQGVLFVDRLCD